MGCRSIATGSHFCEKQQRVLREIKARMRKTECFGAFFSAEARFAITAITLLSLNSALQLTDIQLVTDFSDSSDSKNRKTFLLRDETFLCRLFL